MIEFRFFQVGGVVAGILLTTGVVSAGTLMDSITPSGPGLGTAPTTALVFSFAVNNDNVEGTDDLGNTITPFDSMRFDELAAIDLVFQVSPSGGVSEYLWDGFVINNTQVEWRGFRVDLRLVDDLGNVLDNPLPDPKGGLDLDSPHKDSEMVFTPFDRKAQTPSWIEWSRGEFPANAEVNGRLTISLDIPDEIGGETLTRFALRLLPLAESSDTVLGDLDGNGHLDAFDVDDFELALSDEFEFIYTHPDIDPNFVGDMNDDETFDAFDVAGFESTLAGTSAQTLPMPTSGMILFLSGFAALRRSGKQY